MADGPVIQAAYTRALERGLMKEFAETMTEFEKLFPQSPTTADYKEVRQQLLTPPAQDDPRPELSIETFEIALSLQFRAAA